MKLTSVSLISLAALLIGCQVLYGAADLTRASELMNQNKYLEAQQVLQKILEVEPDSAEAHARLGFVYLKLQKPDEAQSEFQRASEIDPKSDEAQAGLAGAYLAKQEFDKARDALNRAQSLLDESNEGKQEKRENEDLYYNRGLLYLHDRNLPAAVKDLEKVLSINPKNAYAHYYVGQAYGNLKQPDKMVDHLQTFLKLAPDAPEAQKVQALLRSIR